MTRWSTTDFEVGIVGGGPAGLSAALMLGRACRRVVVIDHGKPRNAAAVLVNGYLGAGGCTPNELRNRGARQAEAYGVRNLKDQVISAHCIDEDVGGFELHLESGKCLSVLKLLLATGVTDKLPEIERIGEFFGRSVHHCPYCDGWEHRGQQLGALADADSLVDLAATLLGWSTRVTAYTNGAPLTASGRKELDGLGIKTCTDKLVRFHGKDGTLERIIFDRGRALECDALFFSGGQRQTSRLYESLGCKLTEKGQLATRKKQHTNRRGLFVAGDADGDVQFAIVAAAEGAIAATAINAQLIEDMRAAKSTAPLQTTRR
jgi:thioredoxin reductase